MSEVNRGGFRCRQQPAFSAISIRMNIFRNTAGMLFLFCRRERTAWDLNVSQAIKRSAETDPHPVISRTRSRQASAATSVGKTYIVSNELMVS